MDRGRGRRSSRALAAALLPVLLLVAGCAGSQSSGSPDSAASDDGQSALGDPPDPGFGHVHGLGLNPADGAVYAASHYGVWRIPLQGGATGGVTEPVRIADRFQDTMGFTVAGPDLFLGSGHPDPREDSPPHLGLILSKDRAETWQPISLRGEADFHDLAVVGDRVYGYDSTTGTLLVSEDTGRTWNKRATFPIRDVTVDPSDPERVLATTPDGLMLSRDAGASFRPVRGAPRLLTVDWSTGGLAGAEPDGTVWGAPGADPEAEWERRGRLTGAPQAFTVAQEGKLLAADDSGVQISADGGSSWTLLAAYDG